MIFQDTLLLDAAAGDVWDLLLDVNRFAACMPGVEEIRQIDKRTFEGVISARVGPATGTFAFRATIVESDPPRELLANIQGTDSVTKSTLAADISMTLTPLSPKQTELSYRATVEMRGRLAILGDMVLRATAGLLIDEFGKQLRQRLAVAG